ncbi:polymorphic toxin type 50 domain-containing protein, partial [Campylobacter concisus]
SSNDLYNIELATNFIKQSSFYNTSLDNTNAFNPNKKQYEDRYMYALNAYNNEDFYKDNLSVKTNPGILDYTKSTMYGLGGFAVGGIEGLADLGNIILHPVDAINGLDNAFYHPILTTKNVNANIQEFIAKNFVDSVLGDQSSINYRSYHALGENIGSLGAAGKAAIKVGNKLSNVNLSKKGATADKTTNNNLNSNGNDGIVVAGGKSVKIDINKQNKHIQGTNEYKTANQNGVTRSILTEDVENLLPKFGTGQKVNSVEIGLAGSKERIDFGKVIGYYIDENGNKLSTTKGIVHYGKNGAHIVPSNPN